jgi:GNAT superfamily N-acetyltransferase
MTADDVAAGLSLCRENNWNQTEAEWRVLLEPPSVFRVAVGEGGRVTGTAGAVAYGRDLAWVCMVLVDGGERGHGLGTALVEQVLERLGGFEAVGLDATPRGRPVYARLGFGDALGLHRMAAPPRGGPPPAAESREPARAMSAADLPEVLAWDREAFGADRSRLLRWALEAAPERARTVTANARIEGYCFGRRGQHSDAIGPIVAHSPEAARALVVSALSARADRRVIVDAVSSSEWQGDLAGLGLREERALTRMYLGGRPPREERTDVFAIFGPEFG